MHVKDVSWKKVIELCSISLVASGICGIALKLSRFFDCWVYFPRWPNIVDVAFLIGGSMYLAYLGLRRG